MSTLTRNAPIRRTKRPKKSKLQRKKERPRSRYWRDKADRVWSLVVRVPGRCAICGNAKSLNAHHIIGRNNGQLRHVLMNGICLCAGCHKLAARSAHGNSPWFVAWLEHNRPEQWVWVARHRHDPVDNTNLDYEAAYHRLSDIYEGAK